MLKNSVSDCGAEDSREQAVNAHLLQPDGDVPGLLEPAHFGPTWGNLGGQDACVPVNAPGVHQDALGQLGDLAVKAWHQLVHGLQMRSQAIPASHPCKHPHA